MLFNRDVLFIHVPKTGGMSVTQYLLEVLPRPVYYFRPTVDAGTTETGIVQMPGIRHESLAEAELIVKEFGYDIHEFPLILAVLRNPYALEVSRYAYMGHGLAWDEGLNQYLAINEPFETFAIESHNHGNSSRTLESYFVLNGEVPRNLHILKLENLAEGLTVALRKVGIEKTTNLIRDNVSYHNPFESYYTRSAEVAVYERYKWVFEHGFYERIDPNKFAFVEGGSAYSYRLPIVGPVRMIGPAYGLWPDWWAEDRLKFKVEVEQLVSKITVEGMLSRTYGTGVQLVLTVDGQRTVASFESDGLFTWDIPCSIKPGASTEVNLSTSIQSCSSKAVPSRDDGKVLLLNRIVFESDPLAKIIRTGIPSNSAIVFIDEGGELRWLEEQEGCLTPNTNSRWEKLFAEGVQDSQEAPWIQPNTTYEFCLYSWKERSTRLGTVIVSGSEKAFIKALPNPVLAGEGSLATTRVSWSTGREGSWGQVYVSKDGGSEKLFAEGPQGFQEVPNTAEGKEYEFRLYTGTEHRNLLAVTGVTLSDEAVFSEFSDQKARTDEAFIKASPNPVPAGEGSLATTRVSWSTGKEGSWGQVYVSVVDGEAGRNPVDSDGAIAQLEELREKGADFLLFPSERFWWLDHYDEFKQHLDACYRRTWSDEHCIIYRLSESEPDGVQAG